MGANLVRSDIDGGRLGFGQLVAFRPVDESTNILGATEWLLGVSKWVNVAVSGHLRSGVQYIPGPAEAILVAMSDVGEADVYRPALLLHEVAALKTPPSLILENGCFKPGRVVRIKTRDSATQDLRLGFRVERGVDFERVSFTGVDGAQGG
jgi:hypothetical protein